jgi:prevent-host-death family protein
MKVTASYAKSNLLELLKAVERGEVVTISRYGKAIAILSPAKQVLKSKRKLGTLKGRIKILDPDWAASMTEKDVEAFIRGRY